MKCGKWMEVSLTVHHAAPPVFRGHAPIASSIQGAKTRYLVVWADRFNSIVQ